MTKDEWGRVSYVAAIIGAIAGLVVAIAEACGA